MDERIEPSIVNQCGKRVGVVRNYTIASWSVYPIKIIHSHKMLDCLFFCIKFRTKRIHNKRGAMKSGNVKTYRFRSGKCYVCFRKLVHSSTDDRCEKPIVSWHLWCNQTDSGWDPDRCHWVLWNCVEVFILHRDRQQHRFPLSSVYLLSVSV